MCHSALSPISSFNSNHDPMTAGKDITSNDSWGEAVCSRTQRWTGIESWAPPFPKEVWGVSGLRFPSTAAWLQIQPWGFSPRTAWCTVSGWSSQGSDEETLFHFWRNLRSFCFSLSVVFYKSQGPWKAMRIRTHLPASSIEGSRAGLSWRYEGPSQPPLSF